MTALDVLHQLHALGVSMTPSPDGTVRYKAPKGVLTPALLEMMRQHKAELLDLVEAFEERARLRAPLLAWCQRCGGERLAAMVERQYAEDEALVPQEVHT